MALDGDEDIGECGLFYWNEASGTLVQLIALGDDETILLGEILLKLKEIMEADDTVQYFRPLVSAGIHGLAMVKKYH